MRYLIAALLCLALAAPSAAMAQKEKDLSTTNTQAPWNGPTVSLSHVVIDRGVGDVWGARSLWACITKMPLIWGAVGNPRFSPDVLEERFRKDMLRAGVRVAPSRAGTFIRTDTPDDGPDLAITARVTRLWGDLCAPRIGDTTRWKGAIDMTVTWEVYSRSAQKIVATTETRGSTGTGQATSTSMDEMAANAFGQALKDLMGMEGFIDMVTARPVAAPDITRPGNQPVIKLIGPASVRAVPIGDAAGSGVVISTTDGHGTGFLISSEGYFLTDQHVVGAAKHVTIRWPDGIERPGEVVRSHKGRDVALIKADTRGRQPLAIRKTPLAVGEAVFAIGAPLSEDLAGTVTRGIVSAHRNHDGLAYIQSDVAVTHGNSGGPLLDERGAVVGLAESILTEGQGQEGLNMFTPIADALEFVSATSQ